MPHGPIKQPSPMELRTITEKTQPRKKLSNAIPDLSPAMEDTLLQVNRKTQQRGMMMTVFPPESPKEPMEYLSRTWSVSALEVCKALSSSSSSSSSSSASPYPHHYHHVRSSSKSLAASASPTPPIREEVQIDGEEAQIPPNSITLSANNNNHFSFNSSATSQLVLERIMSQSEVSPLTSGRLSHSSGPLNGSDSPPVSPPDDCDDIVKFFRSHNTLQPLFTGARSSNGNGATTPAGAKTVGRWLKERKEKKKEEARAHNAHLHAAISVSSLASAVAAIAAATAASSVPGKNEEATKTDMALASAATLVAAQCVEAAEAMGAEREHLASVVSSAVNVRSHDDITTLTAAAATALRGAATLKARALKEVWNIAAVLPVDRGIGVCAKGSTDQLNSNCSDEWGQDKDFLGVCIKEFLAKGTELLKRTRKGDLHWKIVSVYINQSGQVMLKMKSRHVGNTITKKKKNLVLEVCKDLPAWPGRHLFEGGELRRYFGLRTESRGLVEFECKNRKEYEIWTQGVCSLMAMAHQRNKERNGY